MFRSSDTEWGRILDEYTSNSDFVLLMSIWNLVVIISEQIQDSNEEEAGV